MSAPSIRCAGPQDAEAIARVHVRAWAATYPGLVPEAVLASATDLDRRRALWTRVLAEGGAVLVAQVEGAGIVGFASFGETRARAEGEPDGELYAIYLLAEHQGRGLGRALLEGARAGLAEAGHGGMILWVLGANERARRFYRRAGGRQGRAKVEHLPGGALEEVSFVWGSLVGP